MKMRSSWISVVWSVVLLFALTGTSMLAAARPALATWSDTNCDGSSYGIDTWKRSQAHDFAQQADNEGYEWGGGCYRLNDKDDTPNAPDSGGEGNDCSGFVFRIWALKPDGSAGFRYWQMEKSIHGPYSTASYYDPQRSDQFHRIKKRYRATSYMDAFVYRSDGSGHIGLIYHEGSGGGDYIIAAKGDAYGTTITYETYRASSVFRAVTREHWTPDCYPRCKHGQG